MVASPILRAVQTAEIVSAALGVPYEVTDTLREYDCGEIEGCSGDECWTRHRVLSDEWLAGRHDCRLAGGESLNDMRARFVPFVEGLVRQYRDTPQTLLLIGHGGLYRWMLPLVVSGVDAAWVEANPLGYAGCWMAEPRGGALVCVGWR